MLSTRGIFKERDEHTRNGRKSAYAHVADVIDDE